MESIQLFQCASENLGNLLLKSNPNITDCPSEVVMRSLERFAVIQTAKSVLRAELMRMSQANDEPIRTFSARVQGKAQTCGFLTAHTCACGAAQKVDYTLDVIKDVILAGIGDPEIQTSVLDCDGVEEKTLNEIISLIERKEKSRKAYNTASSSVSALSSFKRQQNQPPTNFMNHHQQNAPSPSPKIPCPGCRKTFQIFNGRNVKPFEYCINCFRSSRKSTKKRDSRSSALAVNAVDEDAVLLQNMSLNNNASNSGFSVNVVNEDVSQPSTPDDNTPLPSDSRASVSAVSSRPHPKLDLRLKQVGGDKMVPFVGIADTGAQVNIWGLSGYLKAGFKEDMLQKPTVKIRAVNEDKLTIVGGFVAEIEGDGPDGTIVSCRAMVQGYPVKTAPVITAPHS